MMRTLAFLWHVVCTSWRARLAIYGRIMYAAWKVKLPGTQIRLAEVAATLLSFLLPIGISKHNKKRKQHFRRVVYELDDEYDDELIFGINPREILVIVADQVGLKPSTLRGIGLIASWVLPFLIPYLLSRFCITDRDQAQALPLNVQPAATKPDPSPQHHAPTLATPARNQPESASVDCHPEPESSPTDVFSLPEPGTKPNQAAESVDSDSLASFKTQAGAKPKQAAESSNSDSLASSKTDGSAAMETNLVPVPKQQPVLPPPTLDQLFHSSYTVVPSPPPSIPPSPAYSLSPTSSTPRSSTSSTPTRLQARGFSHGLASRNKLLACAASRAAGVEGSGDWSAKELRDVKLLHGRSGQWVTSLRSSSPPRGMPAWR